MVLPVLLSSTVWPQTLNQLCESQLIRKHAAKRYKMIRYLPITPPQEPVTCGGVEPPGPTFFLLSPSNVCAIYLFVYFVCRYTHREELARDQRQWWVCGLQLPSIQSGEVGQPHSQVHGRTARTRGHTGSCRVTWVHTGSHGSTRVRVKVSRP